MKLALDLVLASLVMSALSFADISVQPLGEMKVEKQGYQVRVDSVTTETVGEHGFPSTIVKATGTFSNSCVAPDLEELVVIPQYTNNYRNLSLILVSTAGNRACPMIYKPVTVTFVLGPYTKPNDGLFSKVTVNGVKAK